MICKNCGNVTGGYSTLRNGCDYCHPVPFGGEVKQ